MRKEGVAVLENAAIKYESQKARLALWDLYFKGFIKPSDNPDAQFIYEQLPTNISFDFLQKLLEIENRMHESREKQGKAHEQSTFQKLLNMYAEKR